MPSANLINYPAKPRGAVAFASRTDTLRLGYVPLVDAAPLLAAESLGYFVKEGLRVRLTAELGWGSIRDKIVYGELDAAHAPGGLLFSILCGTHTPPRAVSTDLVLNLQGNAISLSRRLWERGVRDADSLRLMIRSEAPRRPVFAVVSPFSSHLILLRDWLRVAGIDPDRDVRVALLPPPLVGEHMREGLIDGFCAGEPWNSAAALAGEGWIAATSCTLAPRHPEKILLATDTFRVTDEYRALRAAIVRACKWCDAPENRAALLDLLHEQFRERVSREALENSLVGPMNTGVKIPLSTAPLHCFYRHDANAATPQRAAWFFDGLSEAGSLPGLSEHRRACLKAFHEINP